MNTKDFRIGNILIEKNSGELIQVVELNEETIIFSGSFDGDWQAQPIELTEEILLKCGFEKHHPDGNLYSLPWTLTSFRDKEKIDKNFSVALFEGFFVACQCQNTHLRYLHELQNLFYFTSQAQELNTSGLI